jgi:hypothetical protein
MAMITRWTAKQMTQSKNPALERDFLQLYLSHCLFIALFNAVIQRLEIK